MKIVPYSLGSTNDLLTSRTGLLCLSQLMNSIGFSDLADQHFPEPNSNRGFKPSVFVDSVMFMLHEGGKCLDDLRYIRNDDALRKLIGLEQVPESDTLGNWLRRLGQTGVQSCVEVNRELLRLALYKCQRVVLDIDASFVEADKKSAQCGYLKRKGYMPMVGHVAQTGQIVAVDFREGNVAPATDNLAFIHRCEAALPEGVELEAVRIDAAGFQVGIIDELIDRKLKFAIRAKMSRDLKALIDHTIEEQWNQLLNIQGEVVEREHTTRVVHTMNDSRHAFSVVIQRRLIDGQQFLDFDPVDEQAEVVPSGRYLYRAIAISEHNLTDSEWVHWYNQRGEDSENRIKELKHDFAAGNMPCGDFDANALFFSLCALAYNLFVLLRMHLPARFESSRAKTIRWRLYGLAGKVVMHARKICLKLKNIHYDLLTEILRPLQQMAQAP